MRQIPMYIDVSKIRKIFKNHPEITYDILKRIPKETVAGRQVIILNLKGTNG